MKILILVNVFLILLLVAIVPAGWFTPFRVGMLGVLFFFIVLKAVLFKIGGGKQSDWI